MTQTTVHGPVDFVLLEFEGDRLTGRAAAELLELVDRGIVRVYDVVVLGRTTEGDAYAVDLATERAGIELGGFRELAWARSGLLGDDDVREAAHALEPGRLAALIVYENLWAVPFIEAARESGGQLVASARIPAQQVMDAVAAMDELAPTD